MRIVVFVLTSLALMQPSLADECKTSKWGPKDEIGAANLITDSSVLAAARLIKQGKRHGLGIVIKPDMPAFPPRFTKLQVVQPGQHFRETQEDAYGWPISANDDMVQMWLGTGPQIDSLGHLGEHGLFYNCNKGKDFAAMTGMTKLGVEKIPPLVGRGVLVDIAAYLGVKTLAPGQVIEAAQIKAAARQQGVSFKKGDIILLHTGYTDATLESNPKQWGASIPGISNAAAVYLASLEPVAVGADTWGLEAVPPKKGDKVFYGHATLLKENGIYILETMNTGRLAKEKVREFMFVLGHAKLQGAVQMIINPIALW